MYILFSLIMLLSVESIAMDDGEAGLTSPKEVANITTAVTPQRPEKRSRADADTPPQAVALLALDDGDESDDEVTQLLSPPLIPRTPWSAKHQANALKFEITTLMMKICPGALDGLDPSPPLSTSPDGQAFFSKPETLAGMAAVLDMPDAESFKAQIEELKGKFLEGKKRALQHIAGASTPESP